MQPLINGEAYAWAQILFNLFGKEVAGIRKLDYSQDREMQENYGAGTYPTSRGYGKKMAKGSISLEMIEVERLQAAVPSGDLTDIREFTITASWIPEGGNAIVTHTLHNCRFKGNKRSLQQGDMEHLVEIELMISHVSFK